MMRSLSVAACMVAGLVTVPTHCDAAVRRCHGRNVIMASADAVLNCDVRPPQRLSYWMDDPGPIQEQQCLDSGGRPTVFRHREICWDIDY